MSQTVTVPGVGDLEFPDGMSQQDMASAIQKNFPQIHAPAADPLAAARAAGVPVPAAGAEPTAQPSLGAKVRDTVGAGLNLAADALDGVVGMVGHRAGLLGGLAGALGVKLSGGVQPDDPRVQAMTGAKPFTAMGGSAQRTPDAVDEAAQQGAQTAIGAVHAVAGAATRGGLVGVGAGMLNSLRTPGARDIADTIEAPGGALSVVDPQMGIVAGPAGQAAAGAVGRAAEAGGARLIGAANRGAAVAGEGAAAAGKAAAGVAAGVDPELAKVAAIATEKFPDLQVPTDRLALGGTTRKAVGEALATAPGGGGEAVALANKKAFTNYLVRELNPEETAGRLTPEVRERAMDVNGSTIGRISDETDVPAGRLSAVLDKHIADVQDFGSADAERIVPRAVARLLAKTDANGVIPGRAFKEWNTDVNETLRSSNDASVLTRLGKLQDDAQDVMESQIKDPETLQEFKDARRRYAYGMLLTKDTAKTITGLMEPSDLMGAITRTKLGSKFMADNAGGPIGDLAKVGKLIDQPAGGGIGGRVAKTLLAPAAQVHNRLGPKVTRMLTKREPAPPEPPLELAPREALPSTTPPPPASPLGDLTPDWETAPGAAPADTRGAPVDATGLHPALGDERQAVLPQGTGPGREIPAVPGRPGESDHRLGDLTPEWSTQQGAAPREPGHDATGLHPALGDDATTTGNRAPPSAGPPGSQVPAVPGRPDLPDALVSGRPGETAATDTANAAMHEPGAVAARAAQEAAAKGVAAQKAAEEGAKPKPGPAEQTKLDEIDKALATSKSDIVRETLAKERARVLKDVAARDTIEKTKAAAQELRTTAQSITDPATKKAMLQRADKIDPPPPKAAPPKLAETPLPPISYADTPEWRATHGLGPEDAQRAVLTRKALDIDAKAIEAAAVQHNHNPRAFDRVVDSILKKGTPHADEVKPTAPSGEKPETGSGAAGAVQPPAQQRGADSAPAAGTDKPGDQPGGSPEAELEDPAAEAARLAKFHLDHPRASDGTFTEKE